MSKSLRRRRPSVFETLEGRALLSGLTPDEAFGGAAAAAGQTLVDVFGKADVATQIVAQDDGKVLAAGHTLHDAGDDTRWIGVVVRLNADGSPDTTFGGGDGILVTDPLERVDSLLLSGDGKILVGGETWTREDPHVVVVARYNPDGSPDTTFGDANAGFTRVVSGGVFNAGLRELAFAPDGKIVGIAYSNNVVGFDQGDFGVVRFNADGTVDTGFGGGDGFVTTDFSDAVHSADYASAIAFQGGKIVVAGSTINHGGQNPDGAPIAGAGGGFALARYDDDGSLDASFGDDGVVVTPFGDGDPVTGPDWGSGNAGALLVTPAGKLIAIGWTSMGDLTLARYDADGSLDTSFGEAGFRYHAVEVTHNIVSWEARLRDDGNIAVAVAGSAAGVASGVVDGDDGAAVGPIATWRPERAVGLAQDPYYANAVTWYADGNLVVAGHAFPGQPPHLGAGPDAHDALDLSVVRLRRADPAPPPDEPGVPTDPAEPPSSEPTPSPAPTPTPVPTPGEEVNAEVIGRPLTRGGARYKFKVIYTSEQPIDVEKLAPVHVTHEDGISYDAEVAVRKTKLSRDGRRAVVTYVAEAIPVSHSEARYVIQTAGSADAEPLAAFTALARRRGRFVLS